MAGINITPLEMQAQCRAATFK